MAYALSLAVGIAVGLLYAFVGVKSPAPPIIALVGLLGMVVGEGGGSYLRARWASRAPAIGQRAFDRDGRMASPRPSSTERSR